MFSRENDKKLTDIPIRKDRLVHDKTRIGVALSVQAIRWVRCEKPTARVRMVQAASGPIIRDGYYVIETVPYLYHMHGGLCLSFLLLLQQNSLLASFPAFYHENQQGPS